jgi:aspartate/methionine/tyrosine aminotransferase
VYDGHSHVSIAALGPELAERTMIVNSFSKTYAMTGWRIGFNVAPEPLTKATHAVFSQSGRMAAAFTQTAALAAVTGSQEPVEAMLREYARRRDLVVRGLAEIGHPIVSPEGTFYAFLDCRRYGLDSMALSLHILEAGRVVVTPGTFFGQGADGFIRISFAASDEDLANGLAGLRTAFDALEARSA